jgi:hypothetical protein
MLQSLINRIFPLNRIGLIALAMITATPSFILGLMLHANIAGMLAGIACFTLGPLPPKCVTYSRRKDWDCRPGSL